ncbi:hypothetical protein FRB95_013671 [Tulasnella sp. JGI-2019a]|nr:hypothetical protein FRB95_013671 [Tulasnella sp. JGI-2019a]
MARTPTRRRAQSREGSSVPLNDGQTRSQARNASPATNTKKALFVYPDDNQPIHFFLEPEGIPKALRESFEQAIKRRGGRMMEPDIAVPPRGVIILVDPRTEQGQRYLNKAKPGKATKVVPYTFLRACILKDKVLDPSVFEDVIPIFEAGPRDGPLSLKIFIEQRLEKSLSQPEFDDLKLSIAMYGGHSGLPIGRAHVILARKEDVSSLRRDFSIDVEPFEWIKASIKNKAYSFGEDYKPESSDDDNPPSTPIKAEFKSRSPRKSETRTSEFTEEDERHLVEFLAELYPTKGRDNERTKLDAYVYLVTHPTLYSWSVRGGSSTWQNHYTRHQAMFDKKIDEYLDRHPAIVRTRKEAARVRAKVITAGKKTARGAKRGREKSDAENIEEEEEGDGDGDGGDSAKSSPTKKRHVKTPPAKSKKRTRSEALDGDDDNGDDDDDYDANQIPTKKARAMPARRSARQKTISIRVPSEDEVVEVQTRKSKRQTTVTSPGTTKTRGKRRALRQDRAVQEELDNDGAQQAAAEADEDDEGGRDEARVEEELEKSITIDEEEVDQLETSPNQSPGSEHIQDSFPPIREGRRSSPVDQDGSDVGKRDKYTNMVRSKGSKQKNVVGSNRDKAALRRKPRGQSFSDDDNSMQRANIKAMLASQGIDEAEDNDNENPTAGPSKAKTATRPRPKPKLKAPDRDLSMPRIDVLADVAAMAMPLHDNRTTAGTGSKKYSTARPKSKQVQAPEPPWGSGEEDNGESGQESDQQLGDGGDGDNRPPHRELRMRKPVSYTR